jgi:dTDP-4-dehydrorhamnose 3,5-epimerase
MIFVKTQIDGLCVVELEPKRDMRGFNARIFSKDLFKEQSLAFSIVQTNQVFSLRKGTIRGIHMQKNPKSEDKLVQCIRGSIFDVAIDLRKESKTYGQTFSKILSWTNKEMVFIPKGVAHGFQSLQDNSVIQYSVSQYYSPKYETGIRWNDPFFHIDWPIEKVIVSEKDSARPDYISYQKVK